MNLISSCKYNACQWHMTWNSMIDSRHYCLSCCHHGVIITHFMVHQMVNSRRKFGFMASKKKRYAPYLDAGSNMAGQCQSSDFWSSMQAVEPNRSVIRSCVDIFNRIQTFLTVVFLLRNISIAFDWHTNV